MDFTTFTPPRWATLIGLPSSRENGPTSNRDQHIANDDARPDHLRQRVRLSADCQHSRNHEVGIGPDLQCHGRNDDERQHDNVDITRCSQQLRSVCGPTQTYPQRRRHQLGHRRGKHQFHSGGARGNAIHCCHDARKWLWNCGQSEPISLRSECYSQSHLLYDWCQCLNDWRKCDDHKRLWLLLWHNI
jgi:hypothetical protein